MAIMDRYDEEGYCVYLIESEALHQMKDRFSVVLHVGDTDLSFSFPSQQLAENWFAELVDKSFTTIGITTLKRIN